MAQKYAHHLGCDLAFAQKSRSAGARNVSQALGLLGDVRGRRCIVVDDIIDTAGTITQVVPGLLEAGATEVIGVATHALLSPPAQERLQGSAYSEVVVTDSLPLSPEQMVAKISVVSVAPLIASAIRAVFADQSVSEIFQGENYESIPPA
jgi:ribose-phosphate pyrophosphokinase